MEFSLTEDEQRILLETARESIRSALYQDKPEYPEPTAKMEEVCGAFVTIHKQGLLRGCIGNIIGRRTLFSTIKNMAYASAFEDPRFPQLGRNEFPQIDIEISVLSPLQRIDDVSIIEPGKHGIYMQRGFASGVLLPQVAVEQGWDRMTFVKHTCMKAGLPMDAWQDPATKIDVFTAVIFSEKD